MEKIGLLAGIGRLPVEIALAAQDSNIEITAIALLDDVEADLAKSVADFNKINIGQLDCIIQTLVQKNIKQVTMIGKVTKELMFNGEVAIDQRWQKLFSSLPNNNDDTLMLALVQELATEGIGVFDQTMLIKKLMPSKGVLTERQPTICELEDMEFGYKMAKEIGQLDIGQTVVVKHKAVMAVEAIEGTDECIKRGGALGRGDAVVVKVAKPNQDLRFDVPTVGVKTINSMIAANSKALAIEADNTLLVEKSKVLELAKKNNITIVAL